MILFVYSIRFNLTRPLKILDSQVPSLFEVRIENLDSIFE